jgi:hypothetical protein
LNATGLDAGAADHHGRGTAVAKGPDALKVGIEAAFVHVVGMADAAAHHRFFPADGTHLGHCGTLLVTEINERLEFIKYTPSIFQKSSIFFGALRAVRCFSRPTASTREMSG